MKGLALLILLVALAGCALAPQPLSSKPEVSKARRMVMLYEGGAFGNNHRYILADDYIGVEVHEGRSMGGGGVRFELSKQTWQKLDAATAAQAWQRIEDLKIAEWRARYLPSDLGMQIHDGTQWWLSFRDDGRETRSGGDNVYPALSPAGAPTLDFDLRAAKRVPTAFHVLLDLFDELREPPPLEAQHDFSKARRTLRGSQRGDFYPRFSFILADDRLGVDVYQPKRLGDGTSLVIVHQAWKQLDPQVAARAWRRVDALQLAEWRDEYSPGDTGRKRKAEDAQWSIALRGEGRDKQSHGLGVFPAVSPAGAPTDNYDAAKKESVPTGHDAILQLIEELTGNVPEVMLIDRSRKEGLKRRATKRSEGGDEE